MDWKGGWCGKWREGGGREGEGRPMLSPPDVVSSQFSFPPSH